MRKRILCFMSVLALMVVACLNPLNGQASVKSVPKTIKGYVGNRLDIEKKYHIEIDDIIDDTIYYEGDFIHKGKTKVYYSDDYGRSGVSTISVSYSPSLRLIADEWWYEGNYYYLRVYNISQKSVKFTDAKAYYKDKKNSNKNSTFKLIKDSVTIKPGKCKTLKFKRTSGSVSYMPSRNTAYMQMKCRYNDKTYTVKNVHGSVNFYKKSGDDWKFIDYKGNYDYF